MTATTLSPHEVSKAVIAFAKADATLSADFSTGAEIRRANWLSDQFHYPSLRVDMQQMPEHFVNGNCKGQWFDATFSVYVYTEGTSPRQCEILMGHVGIAFQNAVIYSAAFRTQKLNITYINPVVAGVDVFRGEVVVTGRLKAAV